MKTVKYEVLRKKNTTKPYEKSKLTDIDMYKEKKLEEIVWYKEDELRKFFTAIPTDATRDKVLFLTLLGTGKRISEILAIKRNQIDFQNRTMQIITLKKRKKKVDTIRLHQDVAYWLSIYCGSMKAEDIVFPITRQYADDLCKKYAEIAGLSYKRASCHNFRHTFAVRWLEQGKPIHKLQKHLSHSHIITTMIYLKIVDRDYYETVDSLDILGFLRK